MNGIFSYDSKLMQVLGFIADLFLCNIVYLICCLPIVTIGPAQAGLHCAMRTLGDNEDDRSAIKRFFEGFRNGFLKMSLTWLLLAVVEVLLVWVLYVCIANSASGLFVHWVVPLIPLCVLLMIHSVLPIFHSQFDCTAKQLLRNAMLTMITHPIRSVALAVLTWLPTAMFVLVFPLFIQVTPIFLTVYYSIAFLFAALMMKKPFAQLIDHFNGDDELREAAAAEAAREDAEIEALAKANLAAKAAEEESKIGN